jgi:WD40 repeat protein
MKHLALSTLLVLSATASQAQHLIWAAPSAPVKKETYTVAFDVTGNKIISGSECSPSYLRMFNTIDGSVTWDYKLHDTLMCVQGARIGGNGQKAAVLEELGNLLIFDYTTSPPTYEKTIPLGTQYAFSINFSPDNTRVAIGTSSKKLMLYESATGNKIKETDAHANWVMCSDWCLFNSKIATGGDDKLVKVWDADANLLQTMTGHADKVYSVKFTPDGNYVVSASKDKTLKVWDVNTGTLVRTLTGHTKGLRYVDISDDGKMIVSCDEDGKIITWDFNTGNQLLNFGKPGSGFIYMVDFSPNGKYVVAGAGNGEVQLWDITWNTSVGETKPQTVSLSPNPCNGMLQLQSATAIASVSVYDMAGRQCVVSAEINRKGATINTSQLPAGKYILHSTTDGRVVVSHFSKQ